MPRTITNEDGRYIADVLAKLSDNPSSQDMDFLLEAHARVGYLVAIAQGEAEMAEAERKYAEAEVWRVQKNEDPKITAALLDQYAILQTHDERTAEINARTAARKIYNLHQSIEQAINGIKHIERNTNVNLPRLR